MVESGDFVLCYPFLPIGDQVVPTSAAPVGGQDRRTLGISQNGGFAEFVLTDERSLVKVKNEQECRELVALTDAGLAAYKSVSRAALHRHIDGGVAVLGLGGLGHLGIQMLRALGIAPVWGVDPRAETREWAVGRGFSDIFTTGAELQAHLATGEHPCEVVIDFVGSDETAQLALNVLSFGGLYECVGVGGSFTLSTQDLVEREITLQGALVGSMSDLENAISLFQQSDCEVATTQFRLDDIDNALRSLRNGTINGRIIIIP
jgi:NAD+-dependent secondary alcohol dehydrogenase Adh1